MEVETNDAEAVRMIEAGQAELIRPATKEPEAKSAPRKVTEYRTKKSKRAK